MGANLEPETWNLENGSGYNPLTNQRPRTPDFNANGRRNGNEWARKDGKLTLVQCKHRQNGSVGVPVVREMFGLMHHEKADAVVITTTSHFTPEAEAFAEGKPMKLINGRQLWALVREVQPSPSPAVTEALPEIPAEALAESPPCCPRCGGGMHRKERRHDRVPFWGCLRWPECEGSVSI